MIEAIADALLRVTAITTEVGNSLACERLPQGATYPAVVYRAVDSIVQHRVCQPSATSVSRLQVNTLAAELGDALALQATVRTALESFTERTAAGRRVMSCRFSGYGPASKDEFTGMWSKSADYLLMHE
jgi:hypothetical protein